jgi:hypothetical protein
MLTLCHKCDKSDGKGQIFVIRRIMAVSGRKRGCYFKLTSEPSGSSAFDVRQGDPEFCEVRWLPFCVTAPSPRSFPFRTGIGGIDI